MTQKRFKFENLAKQTMSEFFDAENIIKKEILDIREEYEYHLNTPLTLSRVMNILEEQDDIFILYNFVPSKAVLCNRTCCGVSRPGSEHIIKIVAETNDYGLCEKIHITIFNSLEDILEDIYDEIKRVEERYSLNFEDNYCTFLALTT